jgi:hypothetical protein
MLAHLDRALGGLYEPLSGRRRLQVGVERHVTGEFEAGGQRFWRIGVWDRWKGRHRSLLVAPDKEALGVIYDKALISPSPSPAQLLGEFLLVSLVGRFRGLAPESVVALVNDLVAKPSRGPAAGCHDRGLPMLLRCCCAAPQYGTDPS